MTIPVSAFTAGSVSAGNGTVYIQSPSFTSTGAPCHISVSLEFSTGWNGTTSLTIQRGTTTIATFSKVGYTTYGGIWSAAFGDTSTSTGTRYYRVVGSAGGSVSFTNRSIIVQETKK